MLTDDPSVGELKALPDSEHVSVADDETLSVGDTLQLV